ncbi:hypothetical protein ACWEGQ_02775 [Streptomyces seoulensis]
MKRRLISTVAAMVSVLATMMYSSPSATAGPWPPKPKACNTDGAGAQLHTIEAVRLRADKGTSSRVVTVLSKNTDFYAECWGVTANDAWWAYGRVLSGPDRERYGWVAGAYTATGYRH